MATFIVPSYLDYPSASYRYVGCGLDANQRETDTLRFILQNQYGIPYPHLCCASAGHGDGRSDPNEYENEIWMSFVANFFWMQNILSSRPNGCEESRQRIGDMLLDCNGHIQSYLHQEHFRLMKMSQMVTVVYLMNNRYDQVFDVLIENGDSITLALVLTTLIVHQYSFPYATEKKMETTDATECARLLIDIITEVTVICCYPLNLGVMRTLSQVMDGDEFITAPLYMAGIFSEHTNTNYANAYLTTFRSATGKDVDCDTMWRQVMRSEFYDNVICRRANNDRLMYFCQITQWYPSLIYSPDANAPDVFTLMLHCLNVDRQSGIEFIRCCMTRTPPTASDLLALIKGVDEGVYCYSAGTVPAEALDMLMMYAENIDIESHRLELIAYRDNTVHEVMRQAVTQILDRRS